MNKQELLHKKRQVAKDLYEVTEEIKKLKQLRTRLEFSLEQLDIQLKQYD